MLWLNYCFILISGFMFDLCSVPAQPDGFEAETELDTRIRLSWLWPVQDPVVGYELLYWEANNPENKVSIFL